MTDTLYILVNLVERNPCPNGFQLVDPDKSGKKNQFDLVELASQIQTVNLYFALVIYFYLFYYPLNTHGTN